MPLPDYFYLLVGLPSTHLTHLCLSLGKATAELMDQVGRFRYLQELVLFCNIGSLKFLDPLFT